MSSLSAGDDRDEVATVGVDERDAIDDDGRRLHVASNVTEAIEYVDTEAIDCIVSDYHLADGSVLDLLDAARATELPPVVVWTADGNERIASDVISGGAAAYVPKGCEDLQVSIAETIDELVAGASDDEFASAAEPAGRTHHTATAPTPDPLVVFDTATNEVLDCNDPAARLLQTSREALVGTQVVHVHPDAEADRYGAFVEDVKTNPRTVERSESGAPIEVETSKGTRVEVVVDAERVELPNRTILLDTFRPASEHRRVEDSVTAIDDVTRELAGAETASGVAETVVDAAVTVTERLRTAVYLYDESDGVLRRAAGSSDARAVTDEGLPSELSDGIVWQVFEDGERRVSDDVSDGRDGDDSWANAGRELIVPLGAHGVFVAADLETGQPFDDRLAELAERLAGCAVDALDRVKREESLDRMQAQLRAENQRLEATKPFGLAATEASQLILDTTTRTGVENALCDSLIDLDDVSFALVARPSDVDDELALATCAGREDGYVDTMDMRLDDAARSSEPTTRAAATRSTVNVPDIADEITASDWKRGALFRGFQSCLSVPITYGDGFYGVFSIYATREDAFAYPAEQVLEHVVEQAAYAINAVEIRNGALHGRTTELEFTVDDSVDTLYRVADELDCRIEYLNTIPRTGGQSLLEVAVEDVDVDAFEAALDRSAAVKRFSTRERGANRYDVVVSEQELAGRIVELGGNPKRLAMDGAASRLSVELSNEANVRSFVRQLNERETVTLQSQKTRHRSELDESQATMDRLTDRQFEVAKTAYRNGYFEQPRANTGKDIAETMGISQPAFSTHLRKAERVLFESLVEERPGGP